ncbi:MAG: hypothetical protein WA857_15635 [Candidatus Acidiferrum sp.]
MIRPQSARPRSVHLSLFPLLCFALLLAFAGYGCKRASHTSDPRLRKIDAMLSAQLPHGTTRGRVGYFLNSRGYAVLDSPDKSVMVAVVRHIDTETLRPATARVTFHFDSNDKLTTYELQPAPDTPPLP